MTPEQVREILAARLGAEVEAQPGPVDPAAVVPAQAWRKACLILRDQGELAFDYLRSLCGVDRKDAIEVVIHLFSYKHRHAFVLKTRLDREKPVLDTLSDIWPAANWHEREAYDLLGVTFKGHPDPRHLILPEDWVGYPLRKDYQEQPFYHSIPTARPGYGKAGEEAP